MAASLQTKMRNAVGVLSDECPKIGKAPYIIYVPQNAFRGIPVSQQTKTKVPLVKAPSSNNMANHEISSINQSNPDSFDRSD